MEWSYWGQELDWPFAAYEWLPAEPACRSCLAPSEVVGIYREQRCLDPGIALVTPEVSANLGLCMPFILSVHLDLVGARDELIVVG